MHAPQPAAVQGCQQQQQQAQKQGWRARLLASLKAVDAKLDAKLKQCRYWSGKQGSCEGNSLCRFAATHVLGVPTAHYEARADVFEGFGCKRDNRTGRYSVEWPGDSTLANLEPRRQQQQQQFGGGTVPLSGKRSREPHHQLDVQGAQHKSMRRDESPVFADTRSQHGRPAALGSGGSSRERQLRQQQYDASGTGGQRSLSLDSRDQAPMDLDVPIQPPGERLRGS
jgi:hypothetical protein